jgi:glycosyltransferase involved in cell wall biosynthesis
VSKNKAELAVSVVIPTHNPRVDYLARVIDALRGQTLSKDLWELVIVDNGSQPELRVAGLRDQETKGLKDEATEIDLSWHGNARVVREERLGLTFARLRGFAEAEGELIVMVDDDNVLAPDYLEKALRIAEKHPMLGAFGGKCLPEFEVEPEPWLAARGKGLGLRDRGEREEFFPEAAICEASVSEGQFFGRAVEKPELLKNRTAETPKHRVTRRVTEFPDCAPIGAGMVLRSSAAQAYAERLDQRSKGLKDQETITDRKGDSLASGGDNDICLTVIEEGWQVGYLPQLQLTHLISRQRMTLDYHKRMARDSMKSFILMLDQHGIRPWPAMPKWTLPLRVASDWWRVKPWQGADQSLRFWGHVGMYEGRAAL